jgi:hypothetical protein
VNARVFVAGLIAISVLTVAASLYFRASVAPADTAVQILASPDGHYKAVRISLSRSGSSAFCYQTVSVLPAAMPDGFAESEKQYQVYFAPCAIPPDSAHAPTMQWLGNDALQITYTPGPAAFDNPRFRRRVVDASGKVRVMYVVRE